MLKWFWMPYKMTTKAVFVMNKSHRASSYHPSFFLLAVQVSGQKCRKIWLNPFSTAPSISLITLSLLKGISVNSLSPQNLQDPTSNLKLMMVGIPGIITQLFCISVNLSSFKNASLFADLSSFPSLSLISADSLRLDLILVLNNTTLYLLELTVGFESNIKFNSDCKAARY